jgi:tRNA/rRNA methyltransferase
MIHIILIEPEHSGNLGAVARVMKNFGFTRLVLIDPKTEITEETRRRAKHAQDILRKTLITDSSFLDGLDTLIGTTGKLGTDYNMYRSALTPKELPKFLKGNVGIIFGRESSGLSNDEIKRCDFMVTIPASKRYPTLNISHALAIVLYELFQQQPKQKSNSHLRYATRKDKDVLLHYIDETIASLSFSTQAKRLTQKTAWKRIIGKSVLTKREAFTLMGFFRKIR